ncbi:MAG: polysaccharide biosynthesis/export family protein [Candidatus Tectomicrobia bacterium]|nr:polysaccharide biosynthesis/export family protein [Candidatus Tectomicrobia bacterium]
MIQGQPEYIVGPGDVLAVRLFTRGTERELSLLVPPSGTISITFVEDVQAAGRTPSEIDADITRRLSRFFRGPQVDVFVKEYSSKRIFFFGEVNRVAGQRSGPGIYPLSGRTTLLELLLQAGSETPDADLKQVELTRDGKVYGLNLEDALFRGAAEHNPVLQHNDRVLIANKRRFISAVREKIRVSAYGEVVRSGSFDLPADQTFRIMDALASAQGFTQRADLKAIRLIRQEKGKITVQKVNFFDILKGDVNQNVALQDGDQVFLDRSFSAKFSTVLNRVNPILSLILIPAILRDTYTTGGGLRYDTGPVETGVGVSPEVTTIAREQLLRTLPVAP